jgi:hypothetical protein
MAGFVGLTPFAKPYIVSVDNTFIVSLVPIGGSRDIIDMVYYMNIN